MRTCREGIEKHTHLYGVFNLGVICTHLDVGGGRTLLRCVCMHVHKRMLSWDIPLLDPGLDHDWDQQCASRCRCLVPDLLRLCLTRQRCVVTLVRGVDRHCMCGFLAWLRCRLSSRHSEGRWRNWRRRRDVCVRQRSRNRGRGRLCE